MQRPQSKAPTASLIVSLFWLLLMPLPLQAQSNAQADASTLSISTQLVVLDATVLDRQGRIVTQPLTRDDFQVTEDKKLQRIDSFESASDHAAQSSVGDPGKAPLLLIVLDELNHKYQPAYSASRNLTLQFANESFERQELTAFLSAQPAQLLNPTEILILTHHGYRILVQPTLARDAVLETLKRHVPDMPDPYRDYLEETGGSSGLPPDYTLTVKSLEAMWSLALQQRSLPGRKLVLWLGYGGPSLAYKPTPPGRPLSPLERYIRQIIDLLVDARITLDVFYPGIDETPPPPPIGGGQTDPRVLNALVAQTAGQDLGFASYVSATGGFKRESNDIRGELRSSVNYGSTYYTLSYRPTSHLVENQYREIKITIKDHPDWTILTKKGYYAMHFGGEKDVEHQMLSDIALATFEPTPFSAIGAALVKVERLSGSTRARFTFQLDSADLQWPNDPVSGRRKANILISGAALGSIHEKKTLAFQGATYSITAPPNIPESQVKSAITLTLDVPHKTKQLRFIVRDLANGRMGSVDLNPAVVTAAPTIEPPAPSSPPAAATP